jgi:putative oxidoreductase
MASGEIARLLLRLMVGGLMLLHGINKIQSGPGKIAEMVSNRGLPHALAYGVYIGEVLAPILVLLGFWTRPAALVIAFNIVIAISLAHMGDVLHLNKGGGWAIELQALYLFGAVCIALLGAGRYSISRGDGRLD